MWRGSAYEYQPRDTSGFGLTELDENWLVMPANRSGFASVPGIKEVSEATDVQTASAQGVQDSITHLESAD